MQTANDLVPSPLQEELMQAGEDIDDREWFIGDASVELVDHWKRQGVKAYKVRAAIAQFAHKTAETVRDLEGDSRNIPQVVRREFIPPYSRSHLSACVPYVQKASDFGRILGEWQDDPGTRGTSVASLKRHLSQVNGDEPGWKRTLAWVVRGCERLAEDEEAPPPLRRAAQAFVSEASLRSSLGHAPARPTTV